MFPPNQAEPETLRISPLQSGEKGLTTLPSPRQERYPSPPIQPERSSPMAEPQLSIRSAKAKQLAQNLARRTGLPMNKLVERALQHYDAELNAAKNQVPIDAVWDLAAAGRQSVAADAASAHDDLYDADGLPK